MKRAVVLAVRRLVFGVALGAVARGWMRLASADPEFSWEGTSFVVGAFTVWGVGQGIVLAVRKSTSRRWLVTVTRAFGGVATLPLFVAGGAIMAPTVIAGGLARHRSDWATWIRAVVGAVAAIPAVVVVTQFHDDLGWTWRWCAATAGLVAVYGAVVQHTGSTIAPQLDGWRAPRSVSVVAAVALTLAIAAAVLRIGVR